MKLSIVSSCILALAQSGALALDVNTNSQSSVQAAQKQIVNGIMSYSNGDGTFKEPYYWWEYGVTWKSLIDFAFYARTNAYTSEMQNALASQAGSQNNYLPSWMVNQMGNDDEGFWGLAAVTAAERGMPAENGSPSWLAYAQNVYNELSSRWDTQTCSGGLRWQINESQTGYDYKNSVTNGCLFNLAARLARINRGNSQYTNMCEQIWDWITKVGYITEIDGGLGVYDGAHVESGCTDIDKDEWTYNSGLYLAGSAVLYQVTGDEEWLDRAKQLWSRGSSIFFDGDIMIEKVCESSGSCNTDQQFFKGIYANFLSIAAKAAPELSGEIMAKLQATAQKVAASCSGGSDGSTCGFSWTSGNYDGKAGLGEQVNALQVFNAIQPLGDSSPAPNSSPSPSKPTPASNRPATKAAPATTTYVENGDIVIETVHVQYTTTIYG
ncbi:mannan endo-1,6-alpha-mannosidase Dcw1p [Trichomonascus vanleenenianus]|uniref:glycoside hydrolase family 76 protein n=1 Tax=Trichomonascus vanleenenianus TaxID=2268995 RepID=UPI003EC9547D